MLVEEVKDTLLGQAHRCNYFAAYQYQARGETKVVYKPCAKNTAGCIKTSCVQLERQGHRVVPEPYAYKHFKAAMKRFVPSVSEDTIEEYEDFNEKMNPQ